MSLARYSISMESKLSIEIDRPIAQVFELTNKDVTAWSITCVEDEILNETPEVVGTTFRIVTEDRGKRMEFQGVVTKHNPPTESAVQMTGEHFDIEAHYLFEDLGDRTRVTQHSHAHGKGFLKVFFFLFGWAMKKSSCKAQEAELASLKAYCESA